jgi:hypothetical protein
LRLAIEAIDTIAKVYRSAREKPELRKAFLDYINKIFSEGLGAAYGMQGFTKYQLDALEQILFGEEETFVFLWSRQIGKTTMMGVFALLYVFANYPNLTEVLVIGPSLRYSGNLFDKVENALAIFAKYFNALAQTRTGYIEELVETKTRTLIRFAWGSSIRCLPAKNVRGFSPSLILIDEAAFMPEDSWQEILPMLKAKKATKTTFVLTSTPFGTVGRFYEFWTKSRQEYPFHVTYKECPFIDKEGIEKELTEGLFTEAEWRREYLAEFIPSEDAAIPEPLIVKAIEDYETLTDAVLGVRV